MSNFAEWHIWSEADINEALPGLISEVEKHLDIFSEEHFEKNAILINSLKQAVPSPQDIQNGSRGQELSALGFLLDILGRRQAKDDLQKGLELLRAAHELFRSGRASLRPTSPMRQVVSNAVYILLLNGLTQARAGLTDAGTILDTLTSFVKAAWGGIPSQFALTINEKLLDGFERIRAGTESDGAFQEQFVRDNLETLLSLEVPAHLTTILDRWEEVGAHVAPAALRVSRRQSKRPEKLSVLLDRSVWDSVSHALQTGNASDIISALSDSEDILITNLRLRLNSKLDFRLPSADIKFFRGPDVFFEQAKALLLREDSDSLDKFREIFFRKPDNPIAKEWYGYALARFGKPTDIWDIIDALEEALKSNNYKQHIQWTLRWNLAAALRRVESRANEALETLLPLLQRAEHPAEALDLCTLWALEQEKETVLASILPKSPYHEAHLLAAIEAAQRALDSRDSNGLRDHLRRLNRILSDPDYVFPDPKERLSPDKLDALTRRFVSYSLEEAGLEWFRQRMSYGYERNVAKNWECAAKLSERLYDLPSVWQCITRKWDCIKRLRDQRAKNDALREILNWAVSHGRELDGLRILKIDRQFTGWPNSELLLWEERLSTPDSRSPKQSPARSRIDNTEEKELIPVPITRDDPDAVIQQVAASFTGMIDPAALATNAGDGVRLVEAVRSKHPKTSAELSEALLRLIAITQSVVAGADEATMGALAGEMKTLLATTRKFKTEAPFELHSLIQACERIAQSLVVRAKAIPELRLTPPADLKGSFDNSPFQTGEKSSYRSRIFTRISNPTTETASEVIVRFLTLSPGCKMLEDQITVGTLAGNERRIVDSELELNGTLADSVDVKVHVTYKLSGILRASQTSGTVPVSTISHEIPVALRYVTSAPVGPDRTDLFHGRERELGELVKAFSNGRLNKLYFVNGIRRVGKSSLMAHLGKRLIGNAAALLLNLETALAGQKMTAAQFVRALLREAYKQFPRSSNASQPKLPDAQDFEQDSPWVVFEDHLRNAKVSSGVETLLVCFDEVQQLVKRIADQNDPMDEGFLSWLRSKAQEQSDILIICTGSEPYSLCESAMNAIRFGETWTPITYRL